jgi:hypothetical protein
VQPPPEGAGVRKSGLKGRNAILHLPRSETKHQPVQLSTGTLNVDSAGSGHIMWEPRLLDRLTPTGAYRATRHSERHCVRRHAVCSGSAPSVAFPADRRSAGRLRPGGGVAVRCRSRDSATSPRLCHRRTVPREQRRAALWGASLADAVRLGVAVAVAVAHGAPGALHQRLEKRAVFPQCDTAGLRCLSRHRGLTGLPGCSLPRQSFPPAAVPCEVPLRSLNPNRAWCRKT